ncbi:branched-chain amino acid ABC transporter permease [Pseudochelatococcus contaminans]|uniref:Branched-chain amino acid transport system permease protein n=1 Tax=Pseudochelatococcus contaminans TaxID=1538103 RepID=A0A7W5Z569_9HYPH|nr:branched-chain amino acid ABC transporter permease [Pseudochelatococcus contaminans]MBB3810398.1 branched-chain amino acid transport system permease protein [Pseudochelatococcus contaminans]
MPKSLPLSHLFLALALIGFFLVPYAWSDSRVIVGYCVLTAILAIMSYGVDMITSDLGEVSLGQALFLAAGTYGVGIGTTRLGLSPVATLALSIVVALALGAVLGFITLRVREFMFSLVTYCAAVVAHEVAYNLEFLGASEGILGIPSMELTLGPFSYVADTNLRLWPIVFLMLLLVLGLMALFRRSTLGAEALMSHLNPDLAESLGVNLRRTRLKVFLLSAPVTAVGGWLYAYQRNYVGPDVFEPYFIMLFLSAVILLGKRLLLGPLIGVALILFQERFLSLGGDGNKVFLGALLVVMLLALPRGALSLFRK